MVRLIKCAARYDLAVRKIKADPIMWMLRPLLMPAFMLSAMIFSGGAHAQSYSRTLSPKDLQTVEQSLSLSREVSRALIACRDVVLKFQPGIYSGVSLTFDTRERTGKCPARTTIDRASPGAVIFDGGQSPRFLTLLTKLSSFPGTIRNITIRNYLNGIGIVNDGAEKRPIATLTDDGPGMTISNVAFNTIGAQTSKQSGEATGWGAITLWFTYNNVIKNNKFQGIGNATDSSLIHAVYLYGARNNRIEENVFGAMDGTVLKFRNGADQNIVDRNLFRFEGQPLLQEWFCNADLRGAKNCSVPECPSDRISFTNNQILKGEVRDATRRGGGAQAITNPFLSYESLSDLNIAERYYVGRAAPKGCGSNQANLPVVSEKGGNRIVKIK